MRRAAALEVPHVQGDHAARARDAAQLGDAGERVGHEVHDELRDGEVEGLVGERKVLGGGLHRRHVGQSLADRGDERLGRIDRDDGCRSQPVGEDLGERAGTAADIERRWPGLTPSQSANSTDSGRENRPMNRSYAVAATWNDMAGV